MASDTRFSCLLWRCTEPQVWCLKSLKHLYSFCPILFPPSAIPFRYDSTHLCSLVLGRLKQEDHIPEASQGYQMKLRPAWAIPMRNVSESMNSHFYLWCSHKFGTGKVVKGFTRSISVKPLRILKNSNHPFWYRWLKQESSSYLPSREVESIALLAFKESRCALAEVIGVAKFRFWSKLPHLLHYVA